MYGLKKGSSPIGLDQLEWICRALYVPGHRTAARSPAALLHDLLFGNSLPAVGPVKRFSVKVHRQPKCHIASSA